jgi:quinolinate synthase
MVDRRRAQIPGVKVIVHPECRFEVAQKADAIGSTEGIIKTIKDSPPGTKWAVGTELNLVNRLARECAPERQVVSLDDCFCVCSTMFRIDPPHLAWVLESLVEGRLVNVVKVPDEMARHARVALDRMLEIR